MRQYWVAPLPPFHTADSTAYTGTAAIGDISPAPPIVIPGGTLEIGSRLEFTAFGRYTTAATPGTVVAGLYLGPTASAIASGLAVVVSPTLSPAASQTNRTWRLEGNAQVRTVGSGTAATIIASLELTNFTGATGVTGTDICPATAPATFAFDSTVANSVRLGVTPSVTTQSWTTHYFGVRLVN